MLCRALVEGSAEELARAASAAEAAAADAPNLNGPALAEGNRTASQQAAQDREVMDIARSFLGQSDEQRQCWAWREGAPEKAFAASKSPLGQLPSVQLAKPRWA